jgi:hypothetical protein
MPGLSNVNFHDHRASLTRELMRPTHCLTLMPPHYRILLTLAVSGTLVSAAAGQTSPAFRHKLKAHESPVANPAEPEHVCVSIWLNSDNDDGDEFWDHKPSKTAIDTDVGLDDELCKIRHFYENGPGPCDFTLVVTGSSVALWEDPGKVTPFTATTWSLDVGEEQLFWAEGVATGVTGFTVVPNLTPYTTLTKEACVQVVDIESVTLSGNGNGYSESTRPVHAADQLVPRATTAQDEASDLQLAVFPGGRFGSEGTWRPVVNVAIKLTEESPYTDLPVYVRVLDADDPDSPTIASYGSGVGAVPNNHGNELVDPNDMLDPVSGRGWGFNAFSGGMSDSEERRFDRNGDNRRYPLVEEVDPSASPSTKAGALYRVVNGEFEWSDQFGVLGPFLVDEVIDCRLVVSGAPGDNYVVFAHGDYHACRAVRERDATESYLVDPGISDDDAAGLPRGLDPSDPAAQPYRSWEGRYQSERVAVWRAVYIEETMVAGVSGDDRSTLLVEGAEAERDKHRTRIKIARLGRAETHYDFANAGELFTTLDEVTGLTVPDPAYAGIASEYEGWTILEVQSRLTQSLMADYANAPNEGDAALLSHAYLREDGLGGWTEIDRRRQLFAESVSGRFSDGWVDFEMHVPGQGTPPTEQDMLVTWRIEGNGALTKSWTSLQAGSGSSEMASVVLIPNEPTFAGSLHRASLAGVTQRFTAKVFKFEPALTSVRGSMRVFLEDVYGNGSPPPSFDYQSAPELATDYLALGSGSLAQVVGVTPVVDSQGVTVPGVYDVEYSGSLRLDVWLWEDDDQRVMPTGGYAKFSDGDVVMMDVASTSANAASVRELAREVYSQAYIDVVGLWSDGEKFAPATPAVVMPNLGKTMMVDVDVHEARTSLVYPQHATPQALLQQKVPGVAAFWYCQMGLVQELSALDNPFAPIGQNSDIPLSWSRPRGGDGMLPTYHGVAMDSLGHGNSVPSNLPPSEAWAVLQGVETLLQHWAAEEPPVGLEAGYVALETLRESIVSEWEKFAPGVVHFPNAPHTRADWDAYIADIDRRGSVDLIYAHELGHVLGLPHGDALGYENTQGERLDDGNPGTTNDGYWTTTPTFMNSHTLEQGYILYGMSAAEKLDLLKLRPLDRAALRMRRERSSIVAP